MSKLYKGNSRWYKGGRNPNRIKKTLFAIVNKNSKWLSVYMESVMYNGFSVSYIPLPSLQSMLLKIT